LNKVSDVDTYHTFSSEFGIRKSLIRIRLDITLKPEHNQNKMTKIALVTGASSGIGKATAIKLAENGYDLIVCGRREEKLEALKYQLSKTAKVITLIFDVRDRKEVEMQINSLPNEWKNIDLLVNNAGNAHGLSAIHAGDIDDWDAMIDSNVKGLLYVSRAVIPTMV
jgi:NADP-dependent 3-hydroxy acid dehydrogenase YdfG